jgi:hypothetical protein
MHLGAAGAGGVEGHWQMTDRGAHELNIGYLDPRLINHPD